MFAAGVNSSPTIVNATNSRVVQHPDANNPVVQDPESASSSDQFMKLVIEQLKNQDPMNPMESQEFTSQLAQINSLEQLVTLNQTMTTYIRGGQLSEASSLIGQYVEGLDANNEPITGVVDGVEMIDGEATLRIGEKMLLLGQVVTVTQAKDEGGK